MYVYIIGCNTWYSDVQNMYKLALFLSCIWTLLYTPVIVIHFFSIKKTTEMTFWLYVTSFENSDYVKRRYRQMVMISVIGTCYQRATVDVPWLFYPKTASIPVNRILQCPVPEMQTFSTSDEFFLSATNRDSLTSRRCTTKILVVPPLSDR